MTRVCLVGVQSVNQSLEIRVSMSGTEVLRVGVVNSCKCCNCVILRDIIAMSMISVGFAGLQGGDIRFNGVQIVGETLFGVFDLYRSRQWKTSNFVRIR